MDNGTPFFLYDNFYNIKNLVMSFSKIDNITRSALWSSYNNICFYCNRPLDWDEMHIDHLIPEFLDRDKEAFTKVKETYGLIEDFDLNELYNLVPAHSKCNLRKSSELFGKGPTLFYLGLTNRSIPKIQREIEKLGRRKNKGQILSKLQIALTTNLIGLEELSSMINQAEESNWNLKELKLPLGVQFIDEVYDSFYFNMDSSLLYDKKLFVGTDYDFLKLSNDEDGEIKVSTLREWQKAIENGFYPLTTFAIKLSSNFTFLEELLKLLQKAKMPRVSFISEPWIELDNLDLLSQSIINDFEGKLKEYDEQGLSVGDLVKKGIVKINESELYKVSLEFDGIETSFIAQFRADFNNDGVEDVFVRGWTRAVSGTLGFGFTAMLTRYSNKHLIEEIR